MSDFKMEDGKRILETPQDQAIVAAQQADYAALQHKEEGIPDLATQVAKLAAAVAASGVQLPADVVVAANAQLASVGLASIAIPVVITPGNILKTGG